jgi:DNA-binding MarR family transcriptional regulator
MNYELLTDLINAFKEYQTASSTKKNSSMVDFSNWLHNKTNVEEMPVLEHNAFANEQNDLNIEIAKLVIFTNRYAKLLIKKGLANFNELIGEDFTYLYALMDQESMTKIALIEKNIHEKATGLEVIKRLIKHGLIEEKQDETDKRSKQVWLTQKGRQLCFTTFEQMNKVANIVTGHLSRAEKIQLYNLLKKLDNFHNPIYLNEKEKGLDELLAKVAQ